MIITLSGLSGTGKTTVGLAIGERFKLQLISVGEIFRMMAKNANMTLAEFGKLAESNAEIDKKIDREQSKIAEEGDNVLIDGRLSGWMVKNA
ncbi:MAG: AAA family ATPase, partial [Methanocellales archaeon]|nr:AAA family ATPase [Methanocellales archaeon]